MELGNDTAGLPGSVVLFGQDFLLVTVNLLPRREETRKKVSKCLVSLNFIVEFFERNRSTVTSWL